MSCANERVLDTVVGEESTVASTSVGTALDIEGYDGWGLFILSSKNTLGSSPTLAVKLTQCATSGGSYADVTGGAFTGLTTGAGLQTLKLKLDGLLRYIKFDRTLGGTATPSYQTGELLVARKKYTT